MEEVVLEGGGGGKLMKTALSNVNYNLIGLCQLSLINCIHSFGIYYTIIN